MFEDIKECKIIKKLKYIKIIFMKLLIIIVFENLLMILEVSYYYYYYCLISKNKLFVEVCFYNLY